MAAEASSSASTTAGSTAAGQYRFAVRCTGHTGYRSHTEYVFRVFHVGGCVWTVQRRYQELSDLHERLCSVFGAQGLPTFPPKPGGGSMVAAFLGVPGNRHEDVVADREAAFQKYFDSLCGRDDVVRTACFQAALAVLGPEPVGNLRVRGWRPSLSSQETEGECALLDVRADGQQMESSAVVEAFHVVARASNNVEDESKTICEDHMIAEFKVPVKGGVAVETLLVEGLPSGHQVQLEVSTLNALGQSQPVSIRFLVPAGRESDAPADVQAQRRQVEDREAELAQRQLELEQWFAERQREAEQADAERMRQMEDFRTERAALEREREDLAARQRSFSGQGSSAAASPSGSPRMSPHISPRAMAETEDWKDLQSRQEELAQQMEELQQQREQQRQEAARAATEAQARQAELESQLSRREEELGTLREERRASQDLAASQALLEVQRQELARQREEQAAEARRAAEESARLAAEAEAQRAELEQRSRELRALEASREEAVARSEAEQRQATEDLQRQKEELQRLLEEQHAAAESVEATCSQRAAALEAQQELLEKQRLEVESNRAAEEAERASRLAALREQQQALEQEREVLEKDREEEQLHRARQAADIELQDQDLQRKAQQIAKKEENLSQERQELSRSRASLALVQAHVMNLLESGGTNETKTMRLDKSFISHDDPASGTCGEDSDEEEQNPNMKRVDSVDVWSMDWTSAVQGRQASKDAEGQDLPVLQEEAVEGSG